MKHKFKVGDKVRIIRTNYTGGMGDKKGLVGFIREVSKAWGEDKGWPYEVYVSGEYKGYYGDEYLELVKPKSKSASVNTPKKYCTKEQILKDTVEDLETRVELMEKKWKHFKKLVVSTL